MYSCVLFLPLSPDILAQVIDEEKMQANCDVVGTYFLNQLASLRDEFEVVGDVRGKGLMIGIEFVEDKVCQGTLLELIWSTVL